MASNNNIEKLEEIKEKIIDFYESAANFDKVWITDVKEMYYNVLTAWTLIRGHKNHDTDINIKQAESAQAALENSKSRKLQAISELRIYKEEAKDLITALDQIFDLCYNEISNIIQKILPEMKGKAPKKSVNKVSENEYNLLCSVCGNIAAKFIIGTSKSFNKRIFAYLGVIHSSPLNLKDAENIFSLLEHAELSKIHSYIKKYPTIEDGIDAYCPECNKIYCRKHYRLQEEWDEGFYDCTYATCPQNHTRIIDD
ncbi:MAG: hypothetical protein GF329_00945 [Candidatus Lokiarchaeota archaeon]|nr:hypothetical protein [Candidatus Lokiarchaeota archaeon]